MLSSYAGGITRAAAGIAMPLGGSTGSPCGLGCRGGGEAGGLWAGARSAAAADGRFHRPRRRAHAVAEFEAQQEAGSRTPVLDVVVDPANGANALVFPTCAFTSNSILVGRDGSGTGVGIFWSDFDG